MSETVPPVAETTPPAESTTPTPTTETAPSTGAVAASETPAAEVPPPAPVEVKYDLKIPEGSPLDPAALERTVAIARERGLSAEQAQAMVNLASSEAITARDATLAAYQPGGAEWVKQETAWREASLADPELGGGKPEVLAAKVADAKQALERFGSKEFAAFVEKTGFGSHPEVLKVFTRIAKASAEPAFTVPGSTGQSGDAWRQQMYPSMSQS